ncbi:hypothetical protein [Streptomyces sp. SID12488]|uniref:hypothetical protein n=1 Tax=Streptomyces sp. SID12488 TaxID=2706040 RepID=UPI001EF3A6E1|nr:hypothetical protein [Streptomyces sp. SID12488]
MHCGRAGLPALNGAIALIMDRAEASLRQALDTAGTGGPILDAVRVLFGVAAGLAHMDGAGWVHGDLRHTAASLSVRIEQLASPRGRRRLMPVAAVALAAASAAIAGAALLGGGDGGGDDDDWARGTPAVVTDAHSPAAGEIPQASDVAEALRPVIVKAAHRCTDAEVTPAFLAAMLKEESGFDVNAARPASEEYGIAMSTLSAFRAWAVDGDGDGDGDGDKDYRSPPAAISTMSLYVCRLDQQSKKADMPAENLPALMAAGYRTSDRTVITEGGVPERVRPHVEKVLRCLAAYER